MTQVSNWYASYNSKNFLYANETAEKVQNERKQPESVYCNTLLQGFEANSPINKTNQPKKI